jgi:hypothetical protein
LKSAAVDPFLNVRDDLLVAATSGQRLAFGLPNQFDFAFHVVCHGELSPSPRQQTFTSAFQFLSKPLILLDNIANFEQKPSPLEPTYFL